MRDAAHRPLGTAYRQLIAGFGPRLTAEQVGHRHITGFDQPGFGIDDPVGLLSAMDGLAFQHDHPQVAVGESAAALYRGQ